MTNTKIGTVVSIDDLARFLEAVPAPFVVYDPDERIVVCNSAYKHEYHPFEELVRPGVTHTELQWLKVRQGLDKAAEGRAEAFVKEEQDRHRFGPELEEWITDEGTHVRLLRSRMADGHVVGMRFDITDLRRAEAELVEKNAKLESAQQVLFELANIDPLTGLANRRAADERLGAMALDANKKDQALAVVMIDLDGFKQVNDSFGHAAGDHVLGEVAACLRPLVPENGLFARMGGDEFLIAFPCNNDADPLERLAKRVVQSLKKPICYENSPCNIGASVGVALESGPDLDAPKLMTFADTALYQSKASGRGCFTVFDAELKDQAERRTRLTQDMLSGKFLDQIDIALQPIFNARSRRIAGAEALVRWQHPQLGVLQPGHFLPLAADLSLMAVLDNHVLDLALTCRRDWRASGLDVPKISINLSSQRLRDPNLIETLAQKNIPQSAVCFEVLETVFADDDDEQLTWNLDGLREMGIELQVDDYGTAHSSISGLLLIRPQRIKIDRQFCANTIESTEAHEIVRLTVALANALGVDVTAEGVETEAQADALTELGCDQLQGYHLGRPIRPAEFAEAFCGTALKRA